MKIEFTQPATAFPVLIQSHVVGMARMSYAISRSLPRMPAGVIHAHDISFPPTIRAGGGA